MSSQNRWVPARIRTVAPVLQFRKRAEDGDRAGLQEVVHRLLGFYQTTGKVKLECHRNNYDNKPDNVPYYVTLWCVRVTTVAVVTRIYIPFYCFWRKCRCQQYTSVHRYHGKTTMRSVCTFFWATQHFVLLLTIRSIICFECLYSCLRYLACKLLVICVVLCCKLWPVWFTIFFHIVSQTEQILKKKKKSYWTQNVCLEFLYKFCLKHFSF